jgi:NTP-dependent ternary conflict system VMAP-like protein
VPQQGPMLHRTIVVVDVAGFTDPARTMVHQRAVHEGLYDVLRGAFSEVGVCLDTCMVEDRGDGAMILLPPEVDNSKLADQLPSRLVAWLRRYNAVHSAAAAVQLRVALHAGEVYQDRHGAVSEAVNIAFRILEAPEARSALRLSTSVLALVVSDAFYRDVIVHDPAADPGSYRRIPVTVKETSTVAWLRLPDRAAAVTEQRVLDLLPEQELQRLREWLVEITFPQLPTLVHRAAGPGVPPAWSVASAWEAFCHLAEFNAGADGFPPALMFVELVARQVGGDVSVKLTEWNDDQACRLRLEPELRARRVARVSRIPVDSRLHLMIVVVPDGIDPNRYLLSYWRQDDPAEWPPARGETHTVTFDELERHVDDLVVSAERAWSGHAAAAALEFVLPRELLNLPVHRWHKEHDSGNPSLLCLDYPIVVRSLERMRSSHWHRVWHQRWQTLMNDPSSTRVHFGQLADTGERYRIDAVLRDPQWVLMVLTAPPPCQPQPGPDELTAALRSGLPALVWHPEASSGALREIVSWLVNGDGLGDLPGRAQSSRQAAFQASAAPFDVNTARDLVVLWDDPHRLVVLDQPAGQSPDQSQSGGDIANERERAS